MLFNPPKEKSSIIRTWVLERQAARALPGQGAFVDMPARPSAGISVVEVQKLEFFCVFAAPVQGNRRGRGAKT